MSPRKKAPAKKRAAKKPAPKRPAHWERMVLAAFLFMSEKKISQPQVAKRIGRSQRTIRYWMADPLWREARAEAESRWLTEFKDACLSTTLQSVRAGNAQIGWEGTQRLIDELAPRSKHEHSGPGGGPIPHEHDLSGRSVAELVALREAALKHAAGSE